MSPGKTAMPSVVMTIGHSTRPIAEFVHLLKAHGVERLVDVRTVPRSCHNPQFRPRPTFTFAIFGTHPLQLHGRTRWFRPSSADSINMGWRNKSFRGYADYMQTAEFWEYLDALIRLAEQERVAVMCAEAVPWRCHRSLIADALLVRGIEAREITSTTSTRIHSLTPFAQVSEGLITYPAG